MKKLLIALRYLKFRLRATNEHGVHSPFVFALLTEVVYNHQEYYAYEQIREFRAGLLQDSSVLAMADFGAGSHSGSSAGRSVSEIAKTAGSPLKDAFLLFRLVNRFQPDLILELGTSLGLSSAAMALVRRSTTLITIEGNPNIASHAARSFERLDLNNVSVIQGKFDEVLDDILNQVPVLPFVFFDGNHRRAPTLTYFKKCLEKADESSVFILDDIYWSAEMVEAWNEIKAHPRVTVTVDLFSMGIVFFRREQAKQHFLIRF